MAKIPLRSYLHEIESLIERGMNEEAIAHCRFILQYYPKSVETYRMLGKSFLESQRYNEAANILHRVLSVSPDDFFAHVGMSITREDEGNLDAAIFHMERAYESQPANIAVQDELRRLYGRRDGVEPSKLRLSRGALVRMYARGGLHRQAIAEIHAALREDPKRLDLNLILAKIHMELGERIQAFEIVNEIISQLPYCLVALQILTDLLPSSSHAQDAQIYLERMVAVDPYLAYITPSTPNLQQVPDNAVLIDRLDFQFTENDDQSPTWARNAGVDFDHDETSKAPDWLSEVPGQSDTPTEQATDSQISSIFQPEVHPDETAPVSEEILNDIPDWMHAAGWSISDNTPSESDQATHLESGMEGEAEKADLPDWLKEIAPAELGSEIVSPDGQDGIDQLINILPQTDSAAELETFSESTQSDTSQIEVGDNLTLSTEAPAWLRVFSIDHLEQQDSPSINEAIPVPVPIPLPDIPDLTSLSADVLASGEEPLPDWITELSTISSGDSELQSIESIENGVTSDLSETEVDNSLLPEANPTSTISVILPSEEISEGQTDSIHAISGILETAPQETPSFIEGLDTKCDILATIPDNDAEKTLSGLGVSPENIEEGVEPLIQIDSLNGDDYFSPLEVPGIEDEIASPILSEVEPELVESDNEVTLPGSSTTDDGMAWLESLAARHGATDESLITSPDDRSDNPSDWVQAFTQMLSSEIGIQPSDAKPVEGFTFAEMDQDESILESDAAQSDGVMQFNQDGTPAAPLTSETAIVDEFSLHVDESSSTQHDYESEPLTPPQAEMDFDTAFAWLETLAAQNGAPAETLITSSEERLTPQSVWPADPLPEDSETPTQPIKIELTYQAEPFTVPGLPDEEELITSTAPFSSSINQETVEEPIEDQPSSQENTPDFLIAETQISQEEPLEVADQIGKVGQIDALNPLPDWLLGISSEPVSTVIPAQENPVEFPEWLNGLESAVGQTAEYQSSSAPLPEWLSDLQQPIQSTEEPLIPTETEPVPDWVKGLEEPNIGRTQTESIAGRDLTDEALARFDEREAIPAGTETPQLLLQAAQSALGAGKIEISMSYFARLIKSTASLDETIHDLRDALYQYPVDISIWQTLGDAYLRNNQIQEALDAYTKAEEFLR